MTVPPRKAAKPMSPVLRGAGYSVAAPRGMTGKLDAAPFRRRFAKQQRRARGRIDLHAVMHLDDLDVEFGPKRSRRLPHQARRAD